ncbi:N-acetylmuramic acid 6-phosphate etherase [Motilimonas pumila]|uniref:N-acetylmuramic acid 6-phosphate etherase n=1 Tax=Motilimonas pumila TaxID=2303987 RepID=A0A418YFP0_9GAMM|nr:N-acetylmuramic acid 6-phosphate etherase [Motilimonas pumila]RJG48200.1 N-acetylmuramic acid 6-phosphate etherase [Motilimonas pumila]
MKIDLSQFVTESRNQASEQIDTLSTFEMLKVINEQDQTVPLAVQECLPEITQLVDHLAAKMAQGGRLFYVGAGTSGRLGILDASECPPTFGTKPSEVIGLIAGGHRAILQAVENAEDDPLLAKNDLIEQQFSAIDVLVGIAASGRTPYVIGAMDYAKEQGALVAAICCNKNSAMAQQADIAMTPVVGPEVVTGSSRMKAGTAQKLILNMITTSVMIKRGKVFGNLMVDVEATNAKLIQRQVNIVQTATGCDESSAVLALNASQRHCKTAILMILADIDAATARVRLNKAHGYLRDALTE